MKHPFRYSLRFCLALMLLSAVVCWWWTYGGDPYTDFFARIVQQRLQKRVHADLLVENVSSDDLLQEVGVDLELLPLVESIDFANLTSITLYRISPSYVLRIECDASSGPPCVYDAEILMASPQESSD